MAKKNIDTEVEIELKEETPNAYSFMKGLSPITHLRRYLKKKKLEKAKEVSESESDKGIGLYMEPEKVSKKRGGSVMVKTKLGRNKPCKLY